MRVPSYISRTVGRSAGDVRASVTKAGQTALSVGEARFLGDVAQRGVREAVAHHDGEDRLCDQASAHDRASHDR